MKVNRMKNTLLQYVKKKVRMFSNMFYIYKIQGYCRRFDKSLLVVICSYVIIWSSPVWFMGLKSSRLNNQLD